MTNALEFDATTHTYRLGGLPLPSVTTVIEPLYDFSAVSPDALAAAAVRGTAAHAATEANDRADGVEQAIWRPDDPPQVAPYLAAWRRFRADTAFEIHAVEERTYSARHRYAGTIDRLGALAGHRCVLDIKTTSTLSPAVGVQLAAYQAAANEHRPTAERYAKRFACQLRWDATYRLQEYSDPADFSVFLAMLTLRNWRARYGGTRP